MKYETLRHGNGCEADLLLAMIDLKKRDLYFASGAVARLKKDENGKAFMFILLYRSRWDDRITEDVWWSKVNKLRESPHYFGQYVDDTPEPNIPCVDYIFNVPDRYQGLITALDQ